MKRGFTLIETIVYVALLGLLLSTGVLAAFQILQGSGELSAKAVVQDEGDFVLRKISWALSSAVDVAMSGPDLVVTRVGGNVVTFHYDNTNKRIMVRETSPSISATTTTTANVSVEAPTVFSVTGSTYSRVAATTTIKTANGTDAPQTFTITKYLRQ